MPDTAARAHMHDFAIELRKLAYTMPAGHEDRLIRLSDRMVQRSKQASQQNETA